MYQNVIYICISWYSKICWFLVKCAFILVKCIYMRLSTSFLLWKKCRRSNSHVTLKGYLVSNTKTICRLTIEDNLYFRRYQKTTIKKGIWLELSTMLFNREMSCPEIKFFQVSQVFYWFEYQSGWST